MSKVFNFFFYVEKSPFVSLTKFDLLLIINVKVYRDMHIVIHILEEKNIRRKWKKNVMRIEKEVNNKNIE